MAKTYEMEVPLASLDALEAIRGVRGYMASMEQRVFMYHLGMASACGAEIGALWGLSSVLVGLGMKGSGTYYCIDNFKATNQELDHSDTYEEWARNIKAFGLEQTCRPVIGWSYDPVVYKQVPSELDFVYVDGDHETASILRDALLYRQKLRRNGLLVFHDSPWPTTIAAMTLLVETGHMTPVRTVDDFAVYRVTERDSDMSLLNVDPVR